MARRTASLEQALADLQQALRLKSEFMAMISHELRTPLTGVITMAELLEQQTAGPVNERQLAYVHTIQKSGARLLGVVNSIISYAHLVSGDVQLQREPCDLTYLIGLAAVALRPQAAEKQQTLDLDVDPPDLAIESDAEALVQVVKRLLDNAVKFTPPCGKVGLLAQRGPAPATVQIVVWDTGIGVPCADLGASSHPLPRPTAASPASMKASAWASPTSTAWSPSSAAASISNPIALPAAALSSRCQVRRHSPRALRRRTIERCRGISAPLYCFRLSQVCRRATA